MKKRIVTAVLSVLMIISLLPVWHAEASYDYAYLSANYNSDTGILSIFGAELDSRLESGLITVRVLTEDRNVVLNTPYGVDECGTKYRNGFRYDVSLDEFDTPISEEDLLKGYVDIWEGYPSKNRICETTIKQDNIVHKEYLRTYLEGADNPTWTLYTNGTLRFGEGMNISTGVQYDYSDETPWWPFTKRIERVEFDEGVKMIGNRFLFGVTNAKSIILPVSLQKIYSLTFQSPLKTDFYYVGSEEQWNNIEGHEYIPEDSTLHFNYVRPNPIELYFEESPITCSDQNVLSLKATLKSTTYPEDIQWSLHKANGIDFFGDTNVQGPSVTGIENTYWISRRVNISENGKHIALLKVDGLETGVQIYADVENEDPYDPENKEFSISIGNKINTEVGDKYYGIAGKDYLNYVVFKYPYDNEEEALEEFNNITWSSDVQNSNLTIQTSSDYDDIEVYVNTISKMVEGTIALTTTKHGTQTITATAKNGSSASCTVEFEPHLLETEVPKEIREETEFAIATVELNEADSNYLRQFLEQVNVEIQGIEDTTSIDEIKPLIYYGELLEKRVEIASDGKSGTIFVTVKPLDRGDCPVTVTSAGHHGFGKTLNMKLKYYEGPCKFSSFIDVTHDCTYYDDFFDESSFKYNHKMAKFSLSMAMAAFNTYNPETYKVADVATTFNVYGRKAELSPAENAYELLYKSGFDSIAISKDYLMNTEYDGVMNMGHNMGIILGQKTLDDGSTLIFEVLRGGGYGDEWIGNFTTSGEEINHSGFDVALTKAQLALTNYIVETGITGKIKVWLTGFSRAAATSNLMAASLCRNEVDIRDCTITPQDVYAYTFEAPMGTKDTDLNSQKYNGIWNWTNPIDLVPKVAMDKWGYGRYGHNLSFPSKFTATKSIYDDQMAKVVEIFNKYTGENFKEIPQINNQNEVGQVLVDALGVLPESSKLAQSFLNEIRMYFQNNTLSPEATAFIGSAVGEVVVIYAYYILHHPEEFPKHVKFVLKNFEDIAMFISSIKGLAYAHYPELALGWLKTLDDNIDPKNLNSNYWKLLVNCPVDVAVYDKNDGLQLKIVDDVVYPEDGSYIEAFIDLDGQKVISVPNDMDVKVDIIGTNTGLLNYTVQDVNIISNKADDITMYNDLPVETGTKYTGTINGDTNEYILKDQNGKIIEPSEKYSENQIVQHYIEVLCEGNGTVSSSEYKTYGEFEQIMAVPGEDAEFLGWYEGEKCVSTDIEYRFRVERDITLTGKFIEVKPSIKLNKQKLILNVGDSETLVATVVPKRTEVIWTTDDESIATVDQNGKVTAVGLGYATIKATSANGKYSDYCYVDVMPMIKDEGQCGPNTYWSLDWKGNLKITGEGSVQGHGVVDDSGEWSYSGSVFDFVWEDYGPEINTVIIEEGVQGIMNYAFSSAFWERSWDIQNPEHTWCDQHFLRNLNTIYIPSTVDSINEYSFSYLYNLEHVYIADQNQYYCTDDHYIYTKDKKKIMRAFGTQEKFIIPDGVENLGLDAFGDLPNLTTIQFPASIQMFSSAITDGCKNLKTIIGYKNTYAEEYAKAKGYEFIPLGEKPTIKVTGISLDKTEIKVAPGTKTKLKATITPENSEEKTVIWTSSDTTVAKVDQDGNVTAVADTEVGAPSEATITATTKDGGYTTNCKVIVEDPINGFVRRLYKLCFNRTADPGGFRQWTNGLRTKKNTAATTVRFFFTSQEFKNLKLNDEDFVEMCYQVMMDRASDAGGKKNWVSKLDIGMSQTYVLRGFIASREFSKICADYGITVGSISLTEARDQNQGITEFVGRCYSEVLGRKAEVGGLNDWCKKILTASNRKQAAINAASTGFFHSAEYLNKHTTNDQYVRTLYRTFLGREADQGGYNDWMNKLRTGTSRDSVMKGFANSTEFANIMAKYGIK